MFLILVFSKKLQIVANFLKPAKGLLLNFYTIHPTSWKSCLMTCFFLHQVKCICSILKLYKQKVERLVIFQGNTSLNWFIDKVINDFETCNNNNANNNNKNNSFFVYFLHTEYW